MLFFKRELGESQEHKSANPNTAASPIERRIFPPDLKAA